MSTNDLFKSVRTDDGFVADPEDFNNAQRYLAARLFDQLLGQLAVGSGFVQSDYEFYAQRGANPLALPYAFCLTPGAAYLRQGSGNNKVQIAPGTLFQQVGAMDGNEPTFLAITFDGTGDQFTIANGDATHPRVDLLQMKLEYEDAVLTARDFEDAMTRAKSSSTVNLNRRVKCTLSVKAGTPAASPRYPDPDAGYVAVGGVVVGQSYAAAAGFKLYDAAGAVAVLHDLRMPLVVRGHTVHPPTFQYAAADYAEDAMNEVLTSAAAGPHPLHIPCPVGQVGRVVAVGLASKALGNATGTVVCSQKVIDNTGVASVDAGVDISGIGAAGGSGFKKRFNTPDGAGHTPSAGPTVLPSITNFISVPVWTSGYRVPYEEHRIEGNVTWTGLCLTIVAATGALVGPVTYYIAEGL